MVLCDGIGAYMEGLFAIALGLLMLVGANRGVRARYKAQSIQADEAEIRRGIMVVRAIGVLALLLGLNSLAHLIL